MCIRDRSLTTSLINSWMKDRSYGGARGHEGTDLMASVNKRGLYPIVSMTDGVVTNLGWLEKGDVYKRQVLMCLLRLLIKTVQIV